MKVFTGKNKGWLKGFKNNPKQRGYEPALGSGKSFRNKRKKTRNSKGGINLLG
jgi:hypothetical protein